MHQCPPPLPPYYHQYHYYHHHPIDSIPPQSPVTYALSASHLADPSYYHARPSTVRPPTTAAVASGSHANLPAQHSEWIEGESCSHVSELDSTTVSGPQDLYCSQTLTARLTAPGFDSEPHSTSPTSSQTTQSARDSRSNENVPSATRPTTARPTTAMTSYTNLLAQHPQWTDGKACSHLDEANYTAFCGSDSSYYSTLPSQTLTTVPGSNSESHSTSAQSARDSLFSESISSAAKPTAARSTPSVASCTNSQGQHSQWTEDSHLNELDSAAAAAAASGSDSNYYSTLPARTLTTAPGSNSESHSTSESPTLTQAAQPACISHSDENVPSAAATVANGMTSVTEEGESHVHVHAHTKVRRGLSHPLHCAIKAPLHSLGSDPVSPRKKLSAFGNSNKLRTAE